MENRTLLSPLRAFLLLALAAGLVLPAAPGAYADPPPHAPAHGWRKKHDPYYLGYSGKKWEKDYGILEGQCNREAVGAVLGGAAGAVIGGAVSDGKGVAILVGAVLGAVVGSQIGKSMDQADRGCIGHALELAPDNQRVRWTGAGGTVYTVTPVKGFKRGGLDCREYITEFKAGTKKEKLKEKACRNPDGTWTVVG
jgi:surface antigen